MSITAEQFEARLQDFTSQSLKWCEVESEKSTVVISQAIDALLRDAARVSQLSEASLTAIQGLQKKIKLHTVQERQPDLDKLISTLKDLAHEHEEIQSVVNPIIQSLQFQDRLRQNLENIRNMIPIWLHHRRRLVESGSIQADDLLELGKALIDTTTMPEERAIIRNHYQGLPGEVQPPKVTLF